MAEFALGLTKTVVEGALSRIQWAIEEEEKLQDGVQQDLEFITGEFQMMQSFLKVANKERAKNNEVVRAWVRQLRDLAFDVEDWVEFVAHLDKDKSTCCWRLLPSWGSKLCCVTIPRHLDAAAAEMKLLKARVEDVSKRNTRYNLFSSDYSGSGSSLDSNKAMVPNSINIPFQILRGVWMDGTDRLRSVGSLQNLITTELRGNDDLQVIWLWGTENVDVSLRINGAFHDQEICQLFDRRAWVKITSPFKLEEVLNNMLAQLLFVDSIHQPTNGLTSTDLMQQVTKEQRYLVVLEEVTDLVQLSTIRMYLPDNKKGSLIIVSTQNLVHAVFCAGVPYLVSDLALFYDARQSLCAFYKKVPGQSDSDLDILLRKIKHGGVISVYGDGSRKSRVVKMLYRSILQNRVEIDGVMRFGITRWVPVVSDPFELVDFSRRVLVALHYYGFYDGGLNDLFNIFGGNWVEYVLHKLGEEDVIQRSRELLLRGDHTNLVIIDGLRSTDAWDKIKSNILPDPEKCCIVVVTDDQRVARYCVDGVENRLVHVKGVDMRMPPGRIYHCRRERALGWMTNISDPYLTRRRSIYDSLINGCMTVTSPPVVSVWGIAGVGKSALVNWSYTKKMLDPENEDFDHYAWVEVPHPFSLAELTLRLLLQLYSDDPQATEKAMVAKIAGKDLIHECRMWLRVHKGWLLVLDGLRSTDQWESIKDTFCLSQPTYNSRIIVITNEQSVAMHCVDKNKEQVISVQGLEADDALQLFNYKIHKNDAYTEPSDMERVSQLSKSIMAKCGGLPKVIDAVAECYNKSIDKRIYSKLKDINDNFIQTMEGMNNLKGLFSWMQSYLETCKDDLKPCIFYLPAFPIGNNIRYTRLLRRWIAEGYIRGTSSHTEEENGMMLLSELWEMSMFQQQPSSKPDQCRLNGFFHEYITSRPMEDNLVLTLEGNCNMNSQRVGQHLTVRNLMDTDKAAYESTDFSRLRSVTVFGKCWPFMFDPEKIKMRHVRVLDLEDASDLINVDIDHIVELLPRLKFLSIRRCTNITRLPKSIGELRQLQTLDVRYTSIFTLPEAILNLQKLQYVRAGTIQTAPWDEGGIMVECPLAASLTAPAQDDKVAVPKGPVEDVPTAPSSTAPTEDATTSVVASTAPPEDATVVVVSPVVVEDVLTPCTIPAEDGTMAAIAPTTPAEHATVLVAAPTSPVDDGLPASSRALAEDATMMIAVPTAPSEDAAVAVAAPTAPVEDVLTASSRTRAEHATMVVAVPTTPIKDALTASSAAPAEDSSMAAAAQMAQTEDATVEVGAPAATVEGVLTASSTAPAEEGTMAEAPPKAQADDPTVELVDPAAILEGVLTASSTAAAAEGTMVVAAPTAPTEDSIAAVATPSIQVEDVVTAPAEGTRMAVAGPSPTAPAEDPSALAQNAAASSGRPHAFVPRWLSKLRCQPILDNTGRGVEVPAGIGKLTALHTLGVANVGPAKAVILKELHKLTQLSRIGVCGIELGNIHEFFSAIAGLNHLKALLVKLRKNKDGRIVWLDGSIARPPKTLDWLKLHGHVRIVPDSWIKEFVEVDFDLQVTLQEQQDMQVILNQLKGRKNWKRSRLCIKPIHDGDLRIGLNDDEQMPVDLHVLEIVCTTDLRATIGDIRDIEVLRVNCCSGSSLQLSGLEATPCKEVWLKGSYSHTLKQDLQRQLTQNRNKPVLKVLQPRQS